MLLCPLWDPGPVFGGTQHMSLLTLPSLMVCRVVCLLAKIVETPVGAMTILERRSALPEASTALPEASTLRVPLSISSIIP